MTDVLVIGGGLAGWRAAEAASKAGCSVTLVANGDGNSPQIHALNCPVRPDDSAERMFADTMASGHGTNDPALVRILCEGAVKLKDEFPFDRASDGAYLAIQPLGSSVPRCVSIDHAIGAWALAKIRQQCGQGVPALADETWSGRPRPDTSRSDNFDGGRCSSPPPVRCFSGRVESLRWIPQSQGEDALVTGAEAMWSGRPRPDTYPPTFFPGLDGYALQSVKVGRGEMLPHWTLSGALYHVVLRLADSVPAERIAAWRAEREDLKRRSEKSALTSEESSRLEWLQSAAVDEYLDAGAGACWLKRPDVRDVMQRTLERGNEGKFYLHAVGVMPNHLHLVFQLAENESLQGVMQSLKGATAHAANRILGRSGDFWQADFYNHIIRTQEEYSHQVGYVGVKNAGVFGWRLGKGVWTTGNEKCGERTEEGLFEVVVRGCQGEDALATGEGDVAHRQGEDALATGDGDVARRQGEDALATGDGDVVRRQGEDALATGEGDVARASSPLQSRMVLSARAIVLATGGWCGKYGFSTNPPELRGDGIALAQALGAAIRDLDAVQYEPTVAIAPSALRGIPVITTMLYEGATIRNASGKEFLSSRHLNKDEMSKEIVEEIAAGRGVKCQGEDALATGNGVWYDMTGVPADVLRGKYGATYRRYASVGIDISRQPVLVAPAPHTSLGGVVIDTACRVLKPDGSAIPGLFAAGEVTGGLHGRNRLGGNAGTEVLVFGKIAGEEAARFVAGASSPRK